MHLQGFSGRAATTTIHDATETGLSISGIFQAAEDFAVLCLYNAYDYFNHLRLKPRPRTDVPGGRHARPRHRRAHPPHHLADTRSERRRRPGVRHPGRGGAGFGFGPDPGRADVAGNSGEFGSQAAFERQ